MTEELIAEFSEASGKVFTIIVFGCQYSVDSISITIFVLQPQGPRNIRRRIYDALNVLMASGVVERDSKSLVWKGMPGLEVCSIVMGMVYRCGFLDFH